MRTMALETFKILSKSSPEFIQNIITIKEIGNQKKLNRTETIPLSHCEILVINQDQ
jgi:hypothetical protein